MSQIKLCVCFLKVSYNFCFIIIFKFYFWFFNSSIALWKLKKGSVTFRVQVKALLSKSGVRGTGVPGHLIAARLQLLQRKPHNGLLACCVCVFLNIEPGVVSGNAPNLNLHHQRIASERCYLKTRFIILHQFP